MYFKGQDGCAKVLMVLLFIFFLLEITKCGNIEFQTHSANTAPK